MDWTIKGYASLLLVLMCLPNKNEVSLGEEHLEGRSSPIGLVTKVISQCCG